MKKTVITMVTMVMAVTMIFVMSACNGTKNENLETTSSVVPEYTQEVSLAIYEEIQQAEEFTSAEEITSIEKYKDSIYYGFDVRCEDGEAFISGISKENIILKWAKIDGWPGEEDISLEEVGENEYRIVVSETLEWSYIGIMISNKCNPNPNAIKMVAWNCTEFECS